MSVVRDRRLALEEKLPAMDALLGLGTEGPRQLAARIAADCKRLRKDDAKTAARLVEAFGELCEDAVRQRLDREAQREVDELRDVIRGHARDPQLAKETIVAECDPALARLEGLLAVDAAEAMRADEEWAAGWDALLGALADERLLVDYSARCVAALEAQPDGARLARRVERPEDPAGEEERLAGELDLRALMATPMSGADQRVLLANRELAAELDPEELAGVADMNRLRVLIGLSALAIDVKLCEAARGHSKDMLELGFFSHESPVEGKRSFTERAALAGTSASAENIAMGQQTGPGAIDAWWHSPGHHRNMLGGHARVGLGRAESYWTQLFGG